MWEAEYDLLDENHNATRVRSEKFTASECSSYLNMELYSTYLIKLKKCD